MRAQCKDSPRDKILNTKVARRACAGRAPGKHSPWTKQSIDTHPHCPEPSVARAFLQPPMGNSPPRYEERDLLTKLSCSSETLALWGSDINTMAAIFAAADRDGDMTLSTRETRSALKALGIKPSKKTTQRYMSQLDTNLDGVLTFPELVTLVTAVDASQALLEVFHTCSGGGTEVSTQRLREFFAAQGTPMPSALGPSGAVSQADFTLLMHSEHNKWTVPEEDAVWQDMTQPLHHYFIESSHNTYLCGNQLWSSSSVQRYREVLAQGLSPICHLH